MTLTFEVPMPPPELSPNGRPHWYVKAEATREYGAAVFYAAVDARNRAGAKNWTNLPHVHVALTFVFPVRRRRDEDNLRARWKAGYDAIVRAGIAVDDDMEHMTRSVYARYEKGLSKVEVSIEA